MGAEGALVGIVMKAALEWRLGPDLRGSATFSLLGKTVPFCKPLWAEMRWCGQSPPHLCAKMNTNATSHHAF